MGDYIKRQDVIDLFKMGVNSFVGFFTIEQAIENINMICAADVDEVVRCKECKYCFQHNNKTSICKKTGWIIRAKDTNNYCSYGERK